MSKTAHQTFMDRAFALAARGRTSPNPQVGAVVVREGHIVGEGLHRRCGGPHAEVHALASAGALAEGADLYVTLEPCNHQGRTPPCTEAVLQAGIRRVVVGLPDPDPDVQGGGASRLRDAGVEVVLTDDQRCRAFYEAYCIHRRLRRPQVIMKVAMTLDGQITAQAGRPTAITGPEARRMVQRLRNKVDAVLVGVGTVLADDPRLTTRLPRGRGHDPQRIIMDTHGRTPPDGQVIQHQSEAPTVVAHGPTGRDALEKLASPGVVPLECAATQGRVDVGDMLRRLAARGIVSLLVEGGAEVHGAFLDAGLVDRVMFFVAPRIFGGRDGLPVATGRGAKMVGAAWTLPEMKVRRVGCDVLIEGPLAVSSEERSELDKVG